MNTVKYSAIAALIMIALVVLCRPQEVKAGFVPGDESLGGFMYMLDNAEKGVVPVGYEDLYKKAYERFHYEIEVNDEELAILERIVEAEATGGNVEQKMNVASCILARVRSDEWPDTIKEVVFQKTGSTHQFTPIKDGRYYSVKITDETREAVQNVLKNGLTHECLWFCSMQSYEKKDKNGKYTSWHRKHLEYAFYDDEHVYFY